MRMLFVIMFLAATPRLPAADSLDSPIKPLPYTAEQLLSPQVKVVEEKDSFGIVSRFLNARVSLHQPAFSALCVDSLGLGKTAANAIRQPKAAAGGFAVKHGEGSPVWVEYRLAGAAESAPPPWRFELREKEIQLITQWDADHPGSPLNLGFDPLQCHATLLGMIDSDSCVRLPAILHLPDQGSFRITATGGGNVRLGYDASRAGDGYIRVTFPAATAAEPRIEYRLEATTIYPPVAGIEEDSRFNGFRRNWLNTLQLNPRMRVLANNSGSDICAFCVYEYADVARYSPPLAPGLSALDMIRQTLDRILDGMLTYGMPNYPIFDGPICTKFPEPTADTYPSLLIAAREYVTGSGDDAWLEKHYAGLRAWTRKMLATDRDGNGLIEYVVSGNSGSWAEGPVKIRPANWWDTIGFGHEDAYANALAYRALRGMAELAARAGKPDDAAQYRAAADKLRDAYFKTFYNPDTGVLAGWRSADGQLHDYYFLFVNGAAIHYGLVPSDKANAIMDRLLAKLKAVGFTRFDLGLPGNLVPVARKDYVHLEVIYGGGKRDDNSDGFQIYENGGATGAFAYFTLAALYDLGRREEADRILFPMLDAYERGRFQGFGPNEKSYDWKRWDGTPDGYEGLLVDNYYAMLAVLARAKSLQRAPDSDMPRSVP